MLGWLLNSTANFLLPVDGDLVADGVCPGAIVRKLTVRQPTGTAHMKVLTEPGLVEAEQNRAFFRPDQDAIAAAFDDLRSRLAVSSPKVP